MNNRWRQTLAPCSISSSAIALHLNYILMRNQVKPIYTCFYRQREFLAALFASVWHLLRWYNTRMHIANTQWHRFIASRLWTLKIYSFLVVIQSVHSETSKHIGYCSRLPHCYQHFSSAVYVTTMIKWSETSKKQTHTAQNDEKSCSAHSTWMPKAFIYLVHNKKRQDILLFSLEYEQTMRSHGVLFYLNIGRRFLCEISSSQFYIRSKHFRNGRRIVSSDYFSGFFTVCLLLLEQKSPRHLVAAIDCSETKRFQWNIIASKAENNMRKEAGINR